jgi:hypothetical protein
LRQVRELGLGAEAETRGRLVLTLSVLVILCTAPVGALGIASLGPKLLTRDGVADMAESERTAPTAADAAPIEAEGKEGGGCDGAEACLSQTKSAADAPSAGGTLQLGAVDVVVRGAGGETHANG